MAGGEGAGPSCQQETEKATAMVFEQWLAIDVVN
jgi:hypothetical protein